jgi:hypothetical protein
MRRSAYKGAGIELEEVLQEQVLLTDAADAQAVRRRLPGIVPGLR